MSGLGDMGNLLRQAQEMQRQVDRVRNELHESSVEGSSNGGGVRVELSSDRQEVKAVQFAKGVLDPKEEERLVELIREALQDALQRAQEAERAAIDRVTGGMQLPGLF